MVLRRTLSLVPLPLILVATLGFTGCAEGSSKIVPEGDTAQVPPPPSGGNDRDIIAGGDDQKGDNKKSSDGKSDEAGAASTELDGSGAPGPGEPVPEPGTMLLVGSGLAGAALLGRRRRRLEIQTES